MAISRKSLFVLVIGSLILAGLSACSSKSTGDLHMLSMDQMPMEVQSAPMTVQTAYQFAAANPDVMKDIPCAEIVVVDGQLQGYVVRVTVDAAGLASLQVY